MSIGYKSILGSNNSSGSNTYTAGDGIDITNDVISTKQSEVGDIDEIIGSLPSGGMGVTLVNAFNKSDLYSTDEKMIGQWIDGKPLYQRVIVTNPQYGSATGVLVSSDLDSIVSISGIDIETGSFIEQLPVVADAPTNYIRIGSNLSAKTVWVQTNISTVTGRTCWLIVKYTKTTDSAVSIGTANEYSTDEKIVGTWIDGSPIWQRTFVNENMTLPSGSDHELELGDISSLSISKITNIIGTAFRNTNPSLFITIPYCPTSTSFSVFVVVRGNKIYINAGDGIFSEIQKCYITLQYTKTTT